MTSRAGETGSQADEARGGRVVEIRRLTVARGHTRVSHLAGLGLVTDQIHCAIAEPECETRALTLRPLKDRLEE